MGEKIFFLTLKQLWMKFLFSLLQMQKKFSLGIGSLGICDIFTLMFLKSV